MAQIDRSFFIITQTRTELGARHVHFVVSTEGMELDGWINTYVNRNTFSKDKRIHMHKLINAMAGSLLHFFCTYLEFNGKTSK